MPQTQPSKQTDIELSAHGVYSYLQDIVKDKEDFVYKTTHYMTCYYTQKNRPGCVIGHLLVKAGVPIEEIKQWEGRPANVLPYFSKLGQPVASAAQSVQDAGGTWGESLNRAKEVYEAAKLICMWSRDLY